MLEKLLSLLLHAKGGAIATVLVIGASGALVTATVENGTTTVTVTQASPSPSASPTGSASPAVLALFNRTSAEQDPTSPATGNGCSDAAHATNEQVQRVNDGYKVDHAAVLALSKDAPKTSDVRTLVKGADKKLQDFRLETVKAIHDLFKSDECKGNADEDNDQDEDNDDEDASAGTGDTTSTTTTVAISCTDQKACADAAIAEMDKVVETLKADLEKLETAPATTNTTTPGNKPDKSDRDSHDNKGKGKGRG
jgi:hypothetical protein